MSRPAHLLHPMNDWEDFEQERYVAGTQLHRTIKAWFAEPCPKEPVYSLIGPPGIGKSWFLYHLQNNLIEFRNDLSQPCCVQLIRAPELANQANHETIKRSLIGAINDCCPDFRYPYDPSQTLQAAIKDLNYRIGEKCQSSMILLLIDECDNLQSLEDFDRLQREFLLKFIEADSTRFRMLIARRTKLSDYWFKKKNLTIDYEAFDELEKGGAKQIEKLFSVFDPQKTVPHDHHRALPQYCGTYRWNHPYINAYLLTHYIQQKAMLSSSVVETCCRTLIDRPAFAPQSPQGQQPSITDTEFEILVKAAGMSSKEWTESELQEHVGTEFPIAQLNRGSLRNIPKTDGNPNPKYEITDGLCELLRDLAAMRQKGD